MASNDGHQPIEIDQPVCKIQNKTTFVELDSDEYGSQILSRFKEFRDDEQFCDVTLSVEEQQFKVHKIVLAGCSDYFKALFSHGMKDSEMDMFDLPEISLKGFLPLLEFTYSGKLKLNFDTLPDVLSVATFLQMRPAINLCLIYLKTVMRLEDSDDIVNLGMNYGLTELKQAQRRLILDNFQDFSYTRKFYELDADTFISYLEDDSLRIKSEGKLLKCVLRWYKYDKPERSETVADVLKYIRYVQQGWPLIEFAEREDPFTLNKKCQKLLAFSSKYMQDPQRKHLVSDHRTRVRYDKKSLIQCGGLVAVNSELAIDFAVLENMFGTGNDHEKVGLSRNSYYHKVLKKWLPMAPISQLSMRSHCPLVYINDHCVMVGGYVYTQDFTRIYQLVTNEVHLISPSEFEFSMWDMPCMSESRARHAAVATTLFLYAIGGKNEAGTLRSVEQFHLDSEIWSHVTSLPEALYDHAAAAVNEDVYVSGGVEKGVMVKDVWMYNHVTGNWTEKPPTLHRRAGHTMTYVNGQLVVCGGHSNNNLRCLDSVEVFDLELQQWSFIEHLPQGLAHMSATVLDGGLVLAGGVDTIGDLQNAVLRFDFNTGKWSHLCDLPVPMQNPGLSALTVKLTDNEEGETDSLCEEYTKRSTMFSFVNIVSIGARVNKFLQASFHLGAQHKQEVDKIGTPFINMVRDSYGTPEDDDDYHNGHLSDEGLLAELGV